MHVDDRSHLPWVMNPSGGRWYLTDPRPGDFSISDIATNLGNLHRFNGAVCYSVATHSINVAECLANQWGRPDLALQGLLHDAPEAVIGDLVSPLKALLPDFSDIEGQIWLAISKQFGVPRALDPLVLRVDKEMAALEGCRFFADRAHPSEHWWAGFTFGPRKMRIDTVLDPWPIEETRTDVPARDRFIRHFRQLVNHA